MSECEMCGVFPCRCDIPRHIQPEEEAVIEIVRRLFARGSAAGLHDYQKRYSELESAVRALPPKAVRPEDCEPGTRFRFAGRDPSDRPCLMLQGRERMWWPERADCGPFLFGPDDRIIPIEEDQ